MQVQHVHIMMGFWHMIRVTVAQLAAAQLT